MGWNGANTYGVRVDSARSADGADTTDGYHLNQAVTNGANPQWGTTYTNNWFRSQNATGWYNETYGGGIWMDQSSYVRVYGGKGFTVDGSVGIGTTAPATKLHLGSGEIGIGQQNDSTSYMRLGMDSSWYQYLANNAYWTGSAYNYVNTGGYGGLATKLTQYSGTFSFDTASGGTNPIAWNSRIYIANAGNVGIGTTAPGAKLEVAGQIKITGGIPGNGKVLVSDADGLASWTTSPSGNINFDCPANQAATGINADGTLDCVTIGGGSGTGLLPQSACASPIASAGYKRIFVTSSGYVGSTITTDVNADSKCAAAATAAGLTGVFRAVFFSGQTTPREPISAIPTSYIIVNGEKIAGTSDCAWHMIANSPSDFFTLDSSSNYLINPIQYNERGILNSGVKVWTSFKPIGGGGYTKLAAAQFATCDDTMGGYVAPTISYPCVNAFTWVAYTGCVGYGHKWVGDSSRKDVGWAYVSSYEHSTPIGTLATCRAEAWALYCVEQ